MAPLASTPAAAATSAAVAAAAPSLVAPTRMPMEAVFFRLHGRLVALVARFAGPSMLGFVEVMALVNAGILIMILSWLHYRFVTLADAGCLTEALRREMIPFQAEGPVHVVKLHLSGIWSHLHEEDAKSAANMAKLSLHASDVVAPGLLSVWLQDPTFVYSNERGFLMLDEATRQAHGVREAHIRLRTETECFTGDLGTWERYLLDNFVGYDTVALNVFGAVFRGQGYLYSVHSRELLPVSRALSAHLTAEFLFRAVLVTLFLFFLTTTLVHHTLQETQERMLKFTFDLQVYVQRRASYRGLVAKHILGSLVFVPIMVGMLFFLFEFFHDQLLAFMVLSVVWVGELYSVVCVRTAHNARVFPRLFFLYFFSFHVYFFAYPSGFSYLALTTTICLLQHAMLSLFVRHEMPALAEGRVSFARPREQSARMLLLPEDEQVGGFSLAWMAFSTLDGGAAGGGREPALGEAAAKAPEPPARPLPQEQQQQLQQQQTEAKPADKDYIARPARKKRTTIHAEPALESAPRPPPPISPVLSAASSLPPVFVGPVAGSPSAPVAAHPRGGGGGGHNSWVDQDDASSTGGWEIGGI